MLDEVWELGYRYPSGVLDLKYYTYNFESDCCLSFNIGILPDVRKKGLICWNVLATVCANIEVMILIKAF